MTTATRYTAINPVSLDKDGKVSALGKALHNLTKQNGDIDYPYIDKISGRRVSEFRASDTNWFVNTFQCKDCLVGQFLTTTIGQLAESLCNEQFNQYPVSVERVSKILTDTQMGLLKTWVLSEDISVGFIGVSNKVEDYLNDEGIIDLNERRGVITSGRHRLAAIMTFFEFGLRLPYEIYSQQRIRIAVKRYDGAQDLVRAVQAANFTRTMSPAETKNIQSQLKYGVGSTTDVNRQIEIFTTPKATATEQKQAFANSFRLLTQDHRASDLTRFTIGMKLFDRLFGKDSDESGVKYNAPRFSRKDFNSGALRHFLSIAVSEYEKGFKNIGNIARDGIVPAVDVALRAILKDQKQKLDNPLEVPLSIKDETKQVTPSREEVKPTVSRRRSASEPVTVSAQVVEKATPTPSRRRSLKPEVVTPVVVSPEAPRVSRRRVK